MDKLRTALDNKETNTGYSIGENGHIQHSFNEVNFKESIVQFAFQCVRGAAKNDKFLKKYEKMLNSSFSYNVKFTELLLKLMFHIRDTDKGKGEYSIFYNLLLFWDRPDLFVRFENELRIGLKKCFENGTDQPYGSWKDVKNIIHLFRTKNKDVTKSQICNLLMNYASQQLLTDYDTYLKHSKSGSEENVKISLVSKWLPREKSKKYGWQAKLFAEKLGYTMTKYRKVLSCLNKYIQTTEIYQCGGKWSEIDFNKVPSITMHRQREAFCYDKALKYKKYNVKQVVLDEDRMKCRNNYLEFLDKCSDPNSGVSYNSKKLEMGQLVQTILDQYRIGKFDATKYKACDIAWESGVKLNSNLKYFIPMVDLSASMTWENCPYYNAIGLGLRIAEASLFGKRVLTFSRHPKWINLSDCDTFSRMVETIYSKAEAGANTDIYKAIKLILDGCLESNISHDIISKLNLVILSDMQIDEADASSLSGTLYDNIQTLFHNAGLKSIHKVPFKAPRIIFWNMRNTSGFPSSTSDDNAVMISGYNAAVLDRLIEGEYENIDPFTFLEDVLMSERYKF